MTCERMARLPRTVWSQGMRSRPLRNWMPQPGPVAYHVQSALRTADVISTGLDQVAPASVLFVSQTVRGSLLVASRIIFSVSLPRFLVRGSQTVPVVRSTTGQGLPT